MILSFHYNLILFLIAAYLLAGKNTETKKFQMAEKNDAEIINLRRLQKLLLGQLTFESIKDLKTLTKALFKGNAYEAAGAPPSVEPRSDAVTN